MPADPTVRIGPRQAGDRVCPAARSSVAASRRRGGSKAQRLGDAFFGCLQRQRRRIPTPKHAVDEPLGGDLGPGKEPDHEAAKRNWLFGDAFRKDGQGDEQRRDAPQCLPLLLHRRVHPNLPQIARPSCGRTQDSWIKKAARKTQAIDLARHNFRDAPETGRFIHASLAERQWPDQGAGRRMR